MKLEDLRLFGDRCVVVTSDRVAGYGMSAEFVSAEVILVGPDSPLEIGDVVLISGSGYTGGIVLDGVPMRDGREGRMSVHIVEQRSVMATVGAKPEVELPELEPLPPPTDAEQEMFRGAADRAMAAQREKLGLPSQPLVELTERQYLAMTPSARADIDAQMEALGYPPPFPHVSRSGN